MLSLWQIIFGGMVCCKSMGSNFQRCGIQKEKAVLVLKGLGKFANTSMPCCVLLAGVCEGSEFCGVKQ